MAVPSVRQSPTGGVSFSSAFAQRWSPQPLQTRLFARSTTTRVFVRVSPGCSDRPFIALPVRPRVSILSVMHSEPYLSLQCDYSGNHSFSPCDIEAHTDDTLSAHKTAQYIRGDHAKQASSDHTNSLLHLLASFILQSTCLR